MGAPLINSIREGSFDWTTDSATRAAILEEFERYKRNLVNLPTEEELPPEKARPFGALIFQKFRKNEVKFTGKFLEDFEKNMDDNLSEIYAEMMRMAILHPEEINNPEISAGCQEVIEAIRGERVELVSIGKLLVSVHQGRR